MYLLSAIVDVCVVCPNFVKLSKVGFTAKNFGGKANNSPKGLNAWLTIYTIGSAINKAKGTNII
jgi:hypothetical protein